MKKWKLLIAGAAVLTGGWIYKSPPAGQSPGVSVRNAGGHELAKAHMVQLPAGVQITIEAKGMQIGAYGAHIHAVGRCDPPNFASAGPHWNPAGRQHGKRNPMGMHKGDLSNLAIGLGGTGKLVVLIEGTTIAEILDADGAAVVIHVTSDDNETDPSGNSGARMACGVLTAS